MSIGKKENVIVLMDTTVTPPQEFVVKIGKGVFNGNYTMPIWVVTEFGENFYDRIALGASEFYFKDSTTARIYFTKEKQDEYSGQILASFSGAININGYDRVNRVQEPMTYRLSSSFTRQAYVGLQIVVDETSFEKPVYGLLGFPAYGTTKNGQNVIAPNYDLLPQTYKVGVGTLGSNGSQVGVNYTDLYSGQTVSPQVFRDSQSPVYPDIKNGFPYGDGESTSQGGQGEMTDTSDPIEIDSKPLLTTGDFLRVYKLTATDLTALQNKLISDGFLDGLIAKLRTDAMDYIVGLNAIPINATNVASSTIKIANLDTGINASYLSWYIEDIDFGEIALTEYFQTFMDYSPYTKLSVYIPYCGIVPLNVDNFMNDKISMKCRVDMLTGQFVVFVSNSTGIVTTVSGNCAYQLPIRANDYNRLVTSGLGLLGGIVGTAGALATGNVPLAIGAGLGTVGGLVATSQAMTKPDVTSKGSLGGNYGILGNRTPYLIIQRPTISVPSDYGKTIGYMSRITAKLGDLTGYTVLEEIHLEHISATDDEKRLIENALKSGVIL